MKQKKPLACRVLGCVPEPGYYRNEVGYGTKYYIGTDGLGTEHYELRLPCRRCRSGVPVGRFHLSPKANKVPS